MPERGSRELPYGVVRLRPFEPQDEAALLAGRDPEWATWLGPGHPHPHPTACVLLDEEIIGWVDSDPDHEHLQPGETNIGYSIFASHRGRGHATTAVVLMLEWLANEGRVHAATMSVHRDNAASLRVAEKAGFVRTGESGDAILFARRLP